jgi:hypothetical protein
VLLSETTVPKGFVRLHGILLSSQQQQKQQYTQRTGSRRHPIINHHTYNLVEPVEDSGQEVFDIGMLLLSSTRIERNEKEKNNDFVSYGRCLAKLVRT